MQTMLTYHLGLQMLFLATFFPTWEGGAGVYDFVGVSVLTPPFLIASVLQYPFLQESLMSVCRSRNL